LDDYRGVRIRLSRENPILGRIFLLPTSPDSINILGGGAIKKNRIDSHGMSLLSQPEFLSQEPGG
jgi:hypothetical protein